MQISSIALLVSAPFMGSFIACAADRLPDGRALVWSRSTCDHCDHELGPRDLVPVLSWLSTAARCRYCQARISFYYPLVEICATVIAVLAVVALNGPLMWVTAGLGWILLTLAAMDVRHMILADLLTAAVALSGLAVAAGWSALPLRDHVLGMVAGAAALYCINLAYRVVRHRDGLGMGDIKLMAGAGAWVGWQGLPTVLLCATVAALCVTLLGFFGRKLAWDTAIPFGAFICLGLWLTWLAGPVWMGG